MKNLVHNDLRIKCDDPEYYLILRDLLLAKDEYGSEYFTMKKLLPIPEGYNLNSGYTKHGEDWCWDYWGTKADAISEWLHDEQNQIQVLYHTISNTNDKWIEALARQLSGEFCPFGNEVLPMISIEHKYYDLDREEGGYYYWDTRYWGHYHRYKIHDFAAKYHPGLVNYLLDQERFQEDQVCNPIIANPELNPNQVEENTIIKNNIIKN